jgi:eukaryotic-like serine/threonine-protein kinase
VLNSGGTSGNKTSLFLGKSGLQKPMLGRYQIDSEIGRGAMGTVYLGHDPRISRTVAIKTLSLSEEFESEQLEEIKSRFFREAEAAGRLNHPNIVTIYDIGEDQDLAYIAMDYLKGKDLSTYCKKDNRLPDDEVLNVIAQVARALDYAHENHVVHRDIKPANIIYNETTGKPTVTDFGVACLTDSSKTKTGTVLGSPYYMSPEQLAGSKVDGRSDLFSLGVALYQLLSGELPFLGDSMANLMYRITNEKHTDIRILRPDLPNCITNLINKSLNKDIEKRFQSGKQMVASIKRCTKAETMN